jgi:PHD/YefM family antitoxin component YafN of YafNO toxin-antitoxin module
MTAELLEVIPNSEARDGLSAAAARFRREGVEAAPVVFGNQRKPEGVMISFSLFEHFFPSSRKSSWLTWR